MKENPCACESERGEREQRMGVRMSNEKGKEVILRGRVNV